MKKKIKYISKCCEAEVTIGISPDFIGDIPDQMHVGTCNYYCTKCKEPCDIKLESKRLLPKIIKSISLCPNCYCMTYTIKGKCGKCKGVKNGKTC